MSWISRTFTKTEISKQPFLALRVSKPVGFPWGELNRENQNRGGGTVVILVAMGGDVARQLRIENIQRILVIYCKFIKVITIYNLFKWKYYLQISYIRFKLIWFAVTHLKNGE